MKTILLAATLSIFALGADAQQEVRDANHNVKGYINKDGSVQDKDHHTLCNFKQGGQILGVHGNTLGYIVNEYELQDKDHKTKGFIQQTGVVEDDKHKKIAKISTSGSGPVVDANDAVLGYIDSAEPMWAAAYFFLLKY